MAFKTYNIRDKIDISISLSDYISPTSEVRQLEGLINDLDTSMIEETYSPYGQRAYHPKQLLSIIFYGYMKGIRSGRKLSKSCEENINFIYLSRKCRIGKSTFNDFRAAHHKHFSSLFIQIVEKSIDLGLCDASLSIIDGSKIRSNSSKKRSKSFEKYEKWQTTLLEDIEELEELLSSDAISDDNNIDNRLLLSSQLDAKKTLLDKVEQQIELIPIPKSSKSSNENTSSTTKNSDVNLTDIDAPLMKGKKNDFNTYYNVQVSCCENQMITFNDVVQDCNDKAQLIPCIEGTIQNTGQTVKKALADAGYGTLESLEYMNNQNIDGYVPFTNMNTSYNKLPFHASHFTYNYKTDTYTCPKGQILEFYKTTHDKRRNQTLKNYRATELKTCKNCPFREQCAGKKRARRVIQRDTREHLREQMRFKLNSNEGRRTYNRRCHPVEAIFGHLNFNLGYSIFLLRGLSKVKAEFNIMCSAFNLMKIINLMNNKFKNCFHFPIYRNLSSIILNKFLLYNFISNMSMNFFDILFALNYNFIHLSKHNISP